MIKQRQTNKLGKDETAFSRMIHRPGFAKVFAIMAVSVLLASTVYWALLSVQINEYNADQLINSFLFENSTTFRDAVFPGSHSFLLKWPLFFLIHLVGSSALALGIVTIFVTLITVGFLVAILYRIERRPLVFGTLCLALASLLLLVPTESYPGALLPVNFAMLANRNIEYVVYILSLLLIIRSPRLFHWKLITATLLLTLLVASDKLFLSLSLGGGLIALVVYVIRRQAAGSRLALRWLTVSLIASGLSIGVLWLLAKAGVTSISGSTGVGPYGLISSLKDFLLASIYGLLGLFTNLGANPTFDTTIVTNLPTTLLQRFGSISIISYIINFALALGGLITCGWLVLTNIKGKVLSLASKKHAGSIDTLVQLSLMLIWTTLAALIIFVVSNHYYAVDARYLTIILFTVSIAGATVIRRFHFSPGTLVGGGIILLVAIFTALPMTLQTYDRSMAAHSVTAQRNDLVTASLAQHPVDSLLGDYWRVLPIKLDLPAQNILPLSDCLTPRDILTSTAWQKDLSIHSFAYLLPLQPSITGYPACSLDQIIRAYGRPNSTQVIAGSVSNLTEVLLFYDYGMNTKSSQKKASVKSVLPLPISDIKTRICQSGPTIMNIVAHQDDDLLFMNPDILHSLKAGACVRSVYLTAGDAGSSKLYWLGREEGSKAAYAQMLGIKDPVWNSRTVSLSARQYATIAYLKGDMRVSLIFLHLPDGNIDGRGFNATLFESLAKLKVNKLPLINTVDSQSSYTSPELISSLVSLMATYRPNEVRTLALMNLSKKYPDHSDHLLTGWYAEQAYKTYEQQSGDVGIKFYIGYPIRERPENVSSQDVKDASAAFFAYARHDPGTCESEIACSKMSYMYYLKRQYLFTN